MKKILTSLFVLLFGIVLCAGHQVTSGDKAQMVIVYKKNTKPRLERWDHVFKRYNTPDFAARELADFLQKITGAKFKVLEESRWNRKQPAFLVGQTDFAAKNGIHTGRMKQEEWLYKSIGKNIVLAGGFNWGNDIAVYKFLEKELNCYWLSYECSVIPEKKNLRLGRLDRRGEPSFNTRIIYIPPTTQRSQRISKAMYRFLRRNYSNFQRPPWSATVSYYANHSFYEYVDPDVYFKTNPEYFSMNERGERFCGTRKSHSGGQLCLSNPKVREITEAKLREFIKRDRRRINRAKWPTIYEISQSDSVAYICLCPECEKITKREGSASGLLLHFLNAIGESIAEDYPEIKIRTTAYVSTEHPPKYIRPAKNISLEWCDLYLNSDCYRPLSHPFNKKQKMIIDKWSSICKAVDSVYEYWNMGGRFMNPPRIETMVDAIGPDLRYLHSKGIQDYTCESEHSYHSVDANFNELQIWVGQQILDDVTKDEKKLIPFFMKHFYGPAEKPMTRALNMLRKAVAEEKHPLYYMNVRHLYQTPEFVKAFKAELEKALSMTKPGSAYYMRVQRELLPVLRLQCYYDNLKLGKSKKEMVEEYRRHRVSHLKLRYTAKELPAVMAVLKKEFVKLEFNFPTPEKFKHLPEETIRKFAALDITGGKVVKDPDSMLDKVVRIGSRDRKKDLHRHADPKFASKYRFGMYGSSSKKETLLSIKRRLPGDEKYHWYCIRNFKFSGTTKFFAWSWWTLCDLSSVYVDGSDNRWDVWFSLKTAGPTYVKGSKSENNLFLECIILTKPGAVK